MDLRPYQQEDVEFLSKLNRSGCFNQQRTGKTPTALKTFEKYGCKKILIIVPTSAIYQWKEEFELWLGRPCIALVGTPKQKKELLQDWTDGLIVSYGSFKSTKTYTGLSEPIIKMKPDGVILDEAHRIKDQKSAAAKAAFSCRKIPYRIALTGTPAPNKPHEIFSILAWLEPETYTSYWSFIDDYFIKERKILADGRSFINIGSFQKGRETILQTILSKISTQRKRKEVMPWLREKEYQKIKLPATKEQIKYLHELNTYFETENIITQGILDRLIRERQICLHPKILGLKGRSPKVDWIKDYLSDYPDKPILIYSKSTKFIKILEKELHSKKHGVIIGSTSIKERASLIRSFQEGTLNLLIVNIDAGKEAITLDRAEIMIFTDKYPPVGDIQQAEDRGVATTQDRAKKPYVIIELMLKDTYDEQLYQHLAKLETQTDLINDYMKYLRR